VLLHFAGLFSKVELLDQVGEFYKLRVPKENKTIGWLFGQLEDNKRLLSIQEYSVSQTTLEQIFQKFASQSILEDKEAFVFTRQEGELTLMNPDRQALTDQSEP
jgi:hypothetical protein